MSDQRAGINKRVADRLYAEGRIGEEDYRRAVEHARRQRQRIEDALVDLDVVPETALLKYIATLHKTQFVSTERMSKAKLDRPALKVVPKGLATHYGVFPLVLDKRNDKLIVATADPDNSQALQELKMGASVSRVVPMVARPAAVQAAIARGYDGDRAPFHKLLQARVPQFEDMLMGEPIAPSEPRRRRTTGRAQDVSDQLGPADRRQVERGDRLATGEYDPARRTARGRPTADRAAGSPGDLELSPPDDDLYAPRRDHGTHDSHPGPHDAEIPGVYHPQQSRADRGTPRGHGDEARVPGPTNQGYAQEGRQSAPSNRGQGQPAPPASSDRGPHAPSGPGGEPEALPVPPPRPTRRSSMFPRPALGLGPIGGREDEESQPPDIFTAPAYLESLRVLVGLLENERRDLRGHSGVVARLCANICDRINLNENQAKQVVLASYLHDLGKMGASHLTALNVAQMEDHLEIAQKLVRLPEQLMESVGLPEAVIGAVRHMYERVEGGGIPDGLHGKDVPIGARILAVADSYADLTRNANNPYQRLLTPEEAVDVLRQHAGSVFDPNIIEMLERATGGEKIFTDLLANRHRVLVVDPDPEETMVLQLRLVEQGFDVHVARTSTEAAEALEAHEFALVVCEVDLEEREAGFMLRQGTKQTQKGMVWVFLSSRDSRDVAERALKLRVDDFIPKPVSHEILVAKLTQLLERQSERVAPRGVSGSLSQMGLPEIIQILWHGRKTCALDVTQGETTGQIHFSEGQIVDAHWGEATGETAFYRLLALGEDGEFAVDPEFRPTGEPNIQNSPEGLLLEGMRLLDEGQVP